MLYVQRICNRLLFQSTQFPKLAIW